MGQHVARVTNQCGEEPILDRRETNFPVGEKDAAACQIHPKAAEREHGFLRPAGTGGMAERDPDTGQELVDSERPGDVVVRARVERRHLVALVIAN